MRRTCLLTLALLLVILVPVLLLGTGSVAFTTRQSLVAAGELGRPEQRREWGAARPSDDHSCSGSRRL